MEINWIILSIIAISIAALLVFLVRKNARDKKELTKSLNNDFKKREETEFETNDED